ncbi:hypothetical protein [Methylomonas albis]|uniref:hypothetical protein n=1 Tax=Methylomonas albis TaxID=1854563 RepID=UPI001CAA83C2|nr:hypothetical protein [Methylomonas albis]
MSDGEVFCIAQAFFLIIGQIYSNVLVQNQNDGVLSQNVREKSLAISVRNPSIREIFSVVPAQSLGIGQNYSNALVEN